MATSFPPLESDRLSVEFYARDVRDVARDLIGRVLCRRLADGRTLRGRLVEVEAYGGARDRASHAFRGRTPRNAPMFERGGVAYVYQIYGMHFCLNVVSGATGVPEAVLLRASEPPEAERSASGPGRLCRAFAVDRRLDGVSLVGDTLWLESGEPVGDRQVRRTPRIGVAYAGAAASWRYRFVLAGSPHVSGPRRLR
ncbi:MAG TPA: DNA-3-methyladenine glycosylase [Candidatus Polarisedimenticolaceae bacterium]|nr:DNA-3-methyladenine glycosylase [Candidatus Polarisedimenticolaceae bacterium]